MTDPTTTPAALPDELQRLLNAASALVQRSAHIGGHVVTEPSDHAALREALAPARAAAEGLAAYAANHELLREALGTAHRRAEDDAAEVRRLHEITRIARQRLYDAHGRDAHTTYLVIAAVGKILRRADEELWTCCTKTMIGVDRRATRCCFLGEEAMIVLVSDRYSTTFAGSSREISILSADRRLWMGRLCRQGLAIDLNDAPVYRRERDGGPYPRSFGPVFALTAEGLMVLASSEPRVWRLATYEDLTTTTAPPASDQH